LTDPEAVKTVGSPHMSIYSQIICPKFGKKCLTAYKQGCRCNICKTVKCLIDSEYRIKNKNKIKLKDKKYYSQNKSRYLNNAKKYREKNKQKIQNYRKTYYIKNKNDFKIKQKNYYLKNKQAILKRQILNEKQRKKHDILFNLKKRLSHRLRQAFRNKGWKKGCSKKLLGTDFKTLKKYFEKKFLPSMSWDNRHLWHIDHIIPLSSAKTEDELKKLCHYTNLQPLWATDNIKKSNKMP